MMAYPFQYLIVTVFGVVIIPIAAQPDCRFNGVNNIALSEDALLTWSPAPWGTCTIDHFLVYITGEDDTQKVYMTEEPLLDVSFLPMCDHTRFIVSPISPSGIQGGTHPFDENMPVPSDVNLTITSMYLTQAFGGMMLSWYVEEEFQKCAKRFRVLIYDEDNNTPVDEYVTENYLVLRGLIPCNLYRFGVRPLYNLQEEGPTSSLIRYTAGRARIPTPTLRSVTMGTTTVDLVWQMQSFSENKCPVSSVTVDASPYFRIAYPVRDQNSRTYFPTSLTGLQPDTMYMLNVTATNTAGTTMPFFVGVQTLASN